MKKFLSLVLSLALAMGLATTALAAPASADGVEFTTPNGFTYKISSVLKTLGDLSYQVPVGTTITVENVYSELYGPVAEFLAAELKENGFGEPCFEAFEAGDANRAKNYTVSGEPGKTFTFTADKPGLWRVVLMDEVLFYFLPGIDLEVVGDTAEPVPEEPEVPATVAPSNCAVALNGAAIDLNAYLFVDENGGGTNYVMLRDVATILNGTAAQFEVSWSAEAGITLTKGQPYTAVGGEMVSKGTDAKAYIPNASTITVDGAAVELEAYTIEQNNYFKLRDLGDALGFGVEWNAATGTVELAAK